MNTYVKRSIQELPVVEIGSFVAFLRWTDTGGSADVISTCITRVAASRLEHRNWRHKL